MRRVLIKLTPSLWVRYRSIIAGTILAKQKLLQLTSLLLSFFCLEFLLFCEWSNAHANLQQQQQPQQQQQQPTTTKRHKKSRDIFPIFFNLTRERIIFSPSLRSTCFFLNFLTLNTSFLTPGGNTIQKNFVSKKTKLVLT